MKSAAEAVDNRFPLAFYYRMANQIARQAKVYREEGNSDDLYAAFTTYIRLTSEIIPQHQSYSLYSSKEKLHHKKILQEFVKEHKMMKSALGREDYVINRWPEDHPASSRDDYLLSCQRGHENYGCFEIHDKMKVKCSGTSGTRSHRFQSNGIENVGHASAITSDIRTISTPVGTPSSTSLAEARDHDISVHVVRHAFPSSILSCVESVPLVGHVSHIVVPDSRNGQLRSCKEPLTSKAIKDVHISVKLMEEFMELARANTDKDLETCGILGAFFKNGTFYVTTLIVPKQESTSSSCQALNEEEIHAIQDQQSLFPVGWIHTHPSQTCFMSSIDLHTHYSYQVMLPEALAIVMAPTDASKNFGIFRLTDPGGTTVLRECQERGFHTHQEPEDRSPIYEDCSNVYINPNLRFEIIDLRCVSS